MDDLSYYAGPKDPPSLDAEVTFYDPHPGLAGCDEFIPESVRLLANQLVGRGQMRAALKALAEVCPDGIFQVHGDFISLKMEPMEPLPNGFQPYRLNWRVIRFEA